MSGPLCTVMDKSARDMKAKLFKRLINMWPPYLGAGIRIKHISDDYKRFDVEMKMRFYNKNYVGTHFGGSLYAMTDPFYMMILIKNLGKDYIIWDKGAKIDFKKPGKGKLSATFNLNAKQIADIKKQADTNYKTEPTFKVQIKDESGDVVAEVDKVVYVRRKDRKKRPKALPGPKI